jgi:protein CpxP
MPSMKEIVMTEIDNKQLPFEPPLPDPPQTNGKSIRFLGWKRSILVIGLLSGSVAFGAGLVLAAGPGQFGWRHGPDLERIQHAVLGVLDSVSATAAQEAKIHDIIAATFADIAPDPKEHAAMRKQALDLLRAPSVDRAAVEKLRADGIARLDATTTKLVGAVLDAADQLTPEQRAKLAERVDAMAQRGPMGDAWGGPRGGPGDGFRHRPMFDGHGPGDYDDGPAGGSGYGPNRR